MKITFALLFLSSLLAGCDAWTDYPHHEAPATCADNHKFGVGLYGGTDSPTNNTTQTTTSPSTSQSSLPSSPAPAI